jgi:hypothetical protein
MSFTMPRRLLPYPGQCSYRAYRFIRDCASLWKRSVAITNSTSGYERYCCILGSKRAPLRRRTIFLSRHGVGLKHIKDVIRHPKRPIKPNTAVIGSCCRGNRLESPGGCREVDPPAPARVSNPGHPGRARQPSTARSTTSTSVSAPSEPCAHAQGSTQRCSRRLGGLGDRLIKDVI